MDNVVDWIILGRFGRAHGIKGYISIHSFTDPRDNILNYSQWYALIDKQWQPLKLSHIEITNKHILALVDGFNEREQVARLTNIEIAVPKEQLPGLKPGEYYWHQLIGMQVINQQGESLGHVVEMLATGSNDVLVVEGIKRQLIPYLLGRTVIDINARESLITVDWEPDF